MAAPTTYDDSRVYAKYLKKKCEDESKKCGCEGDCSCEEKCGCCPPGLLNFIDDAGVHGCVSPNDYDLLVNRTKECGDGYALVVNNATGQVLGCVSEANFLAIYNGVNP